MGEDSALLRGINTADTEEKTLLQKLKSKVKVDNPVLLVYMVLLIFVGCGNKILLKLQTAPMANYTYFLSQLTTFIYLPIFFGIVFFQFKFSKLITPDMVAYPKRHFFIMGALDSLSGILILFGATNIDGKLTVLLSQGVIPMTMLCAKIFIRGTRYHLFQYIGACVIFCGIVVTLIPSFQRVFGGAGIMTLVWSLVFFAGNIPTALSSVYKEIAFKHQDIDIIYLSAWVALFQFVFGLLLAVPTAPLQDTAIADIPASLWHGLLCFAFGYNSITTGPNKDMCGNALFYTSLYMCFNIVYNILIVLVMKHGSAALMFIVSAVIIPLANICFTFPWLVGPTIAQPFSWTDIVGLVVILGGLIVYRVAGTRNKPPATEEDKDSLVAINESQE